MEIRYGRVRYNYGLQIEGTPAALWGLQR